METPDRVATNAATLNVVSALTLPGLDIFIVVADVRSGSVRPGMELIVPIGSSAERRLTIHGVGPAIGAAGIRIGLAFEAGAWERLAGMGEGAMADGTVLEVREASAHPAVATD